MKHCPICLENYTDEHTTCPTDGGVLLDSEEWEPGTLIRNKYRILGVIGRGGMGIVYRAEHLTLEETRALKVMNPRLVSDPRFIKRFHQEARVARKLRHPNIVQVDDLDQAEDGSLFIAMEYIDGVALRDLLKAVPRLHLPRALAIARGAASALGSAHAIGIARGNRDPPPGTFGDLFHRISPSGFANLAPQPRQGLSAHDLSPERSSASPGTSW